MALLLPGATLSPGAPRQGARRRERYPRSFQPTSSGKLATQTFGPAGEETQSPLLARGSLRRAPLRALHYHPPTVDRLPARGEILLRRADAFEETEGCFGQQPAFAALRPPDVVLLAGVAGEVVEFGLVIRAAQDQGPIGRRDRDRHVVGDPASLGVYGRDDLTLRQIQRPGTDHERPVLLPGPVEDAPEGVSDHGSRHAAEACELHDRGRQVRGRGHRLGASRLETRPTHHQGHVRKLLVEWGTLHRKEPGVGEPVRNGRVSCDRSLRVVYPLGLAEIVVLPEVETVVGGEEDERVLRKAQSVQLCEQAPDPEVDHGDLAAVGGMSQVDVVLLEPCLLPVAVGGVDLLSCVAFPVSGGVVLRRVPGLVRIPGVYVEEELLVVVPLEPPLRLRYRAGDHPVLLRAPRRPRVGALVRPGVVTLAPDPHKVVESSVIPEPVADKKGRVHYAHSVVAGLGKDPW